MTRIMGLDNKFIWIKKGKIKTVGVIPRIKTKKKAKKETRKRPKVLVKKFF